MAHSSDPDTAVRVAVRERLATQRLARATALMVNVDRGALLSDEETAFLHRHLGGCPVLQAMPAPLP